MKTHLNFMIPGITEGSTVTGTVCGREHSQSEDGTNSTDNPADVTCALCLKVIADPKHWRHRKYMRAA